MLEISICIPKSELLTGLLWELENEPSISNIKSLEVISESVHVSVLQKLFSWEWLFLFKRAATYCCLNHHRNMQLSVVCVWMYLQQTNSRDVYPPVIATVCQLLLSFIVSVSLCPTLFMALWFYWDSVFRETGPFYSICCCFLLWCFICIFLFCTVQHFVTSFWKVLYR